MKSILSHKKKKITLEELQEYLGQDSYPEFATKIKELIEAGILEPIRSSNRNGKTPSLYLSYRICHPKEVQAELMEELLYRINPILKTDYYMKNQVAYELDREMVLRLDRFLREDRDRLKVRASFNERSFEIWYREKYLLREGGLKLLKNLGLTTETLNVYETTEPMAYYSQHKQVPQNILILENKDTFYTMRKHLLDSNELICGMAIGTLIYGGGKSIYRSFQDFALCAEPYLIDKGNCLYYFGDLDYEGILIYETLAAMYEANVKLEPFVPAYEAMLEKVFKKAIFNLLPQMKEGQNRSIDQRFLQAFCTEVQEKMIEVLEYNRYIPQEILQSGDL